MKLPTTPFTLINWHDLPATIYPGEAGHASWRTVELGDIRIRCVDYSPGYVADHWCDRGHILFVLGGELDCTLKDGRSFKLTEGMSYHVSNFGDAAHRSATVVGAQLFIVD